MPAQPVTADADNEATADSVQTAMDISDGRPSERTPLLPREPSPAPQVRPCHVVRHVRESPEPTAAAEDAAQSSEMSRFIPMHGGVHRQTIVAAVILIVLRLLGRKECIVISFHRKFQARRRCQERTRRGFAGSWSPSDEHVGASLPVHHPRSPSSSLSFPSNSCWLKFYSYTTKLRSPSSHSTPLDDLDLNLLDLLPL
ncbi:hypothetical protein MARPO_0012s0055 [Marchantia polymorpha]|uniref:Uncharacterized protein n=1 Tax=Marchantia polymorpha TaxID=3197 RepID=A0A2R6XJ06_MARPO|nr:hypothetical protein MARPO_0012s0055 [Marchantia polymorpha]|eukprot:PTQ46097.1 hypothetical protein MARPO_0012s0055 [Marchantia polymorpha]